ncbi:MAG: hypothetical protein R6X02_10935 [Enhygromyxa sp.]
MSFSAGFLTVLVYFALIAVALGVALLLALLLRDAKDRKLW